MKKRLWGLIFVAGLFLSLGVSVAKLNAQSDRGTITGTVTDQTGAPMVNVSVTARNTETGVTSKATTGPAGIYTIPLMPAGIYQVTSELVRFKTSVHDKVIVQVNQTTRLDIVMEVGEVTESIAVSSEMSMACDGLADSRPSQYHSEKPH